MAIFKHACLAVLVTLASCQEVCDSEAIPARAASLLQAQRVMPHAHTDDKKADVPDVVLTASKAAATGRLSTWQEAFKQDPKLFEGCTKVFVDVGSNRGTHVRKLFEPEKYSAAPYLRVFNEGFGTARSGPSSQTGICTFAFEANPRWTETLTEIQSHYAAKGWRARWFAPMAASDRSHNITFWLNDQNGESSDWGASTVKEHIWSKAVEVPAIDLSGFMEVLNKHASPGYRLMKMDIESAEFTVLPGFLAKNILCKSVLDKLTIEWHVSVVPANEVNAAYDLKAKVESPTKCGNAPSTIVEPIDDESYLDDGQPLP